MFLDESLFDVALEITDDTTPPRDPPDVEALVEIAVALAVPERVTLSVTPAAPVGTGCPSCNVRN